MKKTLLLATALMFGTAAMAQDMGAQTPPANQPMAGPSAGSPAPDTTMPATTDAPMAAPADSTPPAAGAPMPAADAPMTNSAAPMASSAAPMASDTSTYPPCSRTVTDKCMSGGKKMAMKSKSHMMKKKSM